jgi:hypothetical protein
MHILWPGARRRLLHAIVRPDVAKEWFHRGLAREMGKAGQASPEPFVWAMLLIAALAIIFGR